MPLTKAVLSGLTLRRRPSSRRAPISSWCELTVALASIPQAFLPAWTWSSAIARQPEATSSYSCRGENHASDQSTALVALPNTIGAAFCSAVQALGLHLRTALKTSEQRSRPQNSACEGLRGPRAGPLTARVRSVHFGNSGCGSTILTQRCALIRKFRLQIGVDDRQSFAL